MLFTDSTKGLMNLKTPIDSKYNSMKAFNKLLLASKLLKKKKQQQQKHDLKRSELLKMSTSFTKSIIMPIKVIMTLMMN